MIQPKMGKIAEASLRRLALIHAGHHGTPSEFLVFNVTTVAEAYVDAALRVLINESGYADSAFGRSMFAELEDRIFGTWPERHDWLKKAFRINILSTSASQDLLTLVDLRNALAHGGGRLTDRQSRDLSSLVTLEHRLRLTLDVRADGRALTLGENTGRRSVEIAREYVAALDAEVRLHHPGVAV